jgi:hypothetical protein
VITPLLAAFPPGLYDSLPKNPDGTLQPITNASEILIIIGNVIRIGIAFAGALAVIFIVVGGIFYVISAGNPSNIKRAKDILTNAIVGLVIAILSYSLVSFLVGRF